MRKPNDRTRRRPSRLLIIFLSFAAILFLVAGVANVYYIHKHVPLLQKQANLSAKMEEFLDSENSSQSVDANVLEHFEDKMLAQFAGYQQQISVLLAISAFVFTIFGIAMPVITHRMDRELISDQKADIQDASEKLKDNLLSKNENLKDALLDENKALAHSLRSEYTQQAKDLERRLEKHETQLQESLDLVAKLAWVGTLAIPRRNPLRRALLNQAEGKMKSWIYFLLADSSNEDGFDSYAVTDNSDSYVKIIEYLKQAIELHGEEGLYYHLLGQNYSQLYSYESEEDDYTRASKNLQKALLFSLQSNDAEAVRQINGEISDLEVIKRQWDEEKRRKDEETIQMNRENNDDNDNDGEDS